MDLTRPIDITAVNAAVVKAKDVLVSLDRLEANSFLQHCTPYSGVTDSITLGRKENGQILKKYTGIFLATNSLGKIVPRTLKVYPVVGEVADEPERYRRSFITEVTGGLDVNKHPFEVWLIQDCIRQASEDLLQALMTAKHSDEQGHTAVIDSFDSFGSIITDEIAAGTISVANGNMTETGILTRANVGEKLKAMWRAMPETFRMKSNVKMFISSAVGDMYDDWFQDEHLRLPDFEATGQQYLDGSNKRCQLVRVTNLPEGSQFVMLTTKANLAYGYDKDSQFKNMVAFFKDPYLFTAAMKFVFGTQLVSINPKEFMVNDMPVTPAAAVPTITANKASLSISGSTTTPGVGVIEVYGANLSEGIEASITGTDGALFTDAGTLLADGGTLEITYDPTVAGTHAAVLTLSSEGADDLVIALAGVSVADPTILTDVTSLEITATTTVPASKDIVISGIDLAANVTATIIGSDGSLFTKAGTLTKSGTLTVTFTPLATGDKAAILQLVSAGADTVLIPLIGHCAE